MGRPKKKEPAESVGAMLARMRWAKTPKKERSRIASEIAKARWRRYRKEHAAELE